MSLSNLVPTYLRHEQIVRETAHSAAEQTQAASLAKLFRLFKEHLHADTYAEQRSSLPHTFEHKLIESALNQRCHASSECPNSGKYQTFGGAQDVRLRAHDCKAAAGRKRFFD